MEKELTFFGIYYSRDEGILRIGGFWIILAVAIVIKIVFF